MIISFFFSCTNHPLFRPLACFATQINPKPHTLTLNLNLNPKPKHCTYYIQSSVIVECFSFSLNLNLNPELKPYTYYIQSSVKVECFSCPESNIFFFFFFK